MIVALAVGVVGFSGCGKARTPASETPPPPAENATTTAPADHTPPVENATAPADQTPAVSTKPAASLPPIAAPNGQPDVAEVNRTLIRWIVRNRRPPANFADFAASAGTPSPPAPPGQKYIITKTMHVQLCPSNYSIIPVKTPKKNRSSNATQSARSQKPRLRALL